MKFLYILYSKTRDRYYVGATNDLERRIAEHNRGQTLSTRSGRPWILVYFRKTDRATALERKLKRHASRNLIQSIVRAQEDFLD